MKILLNNTPKKSDNILKLNISFNISNSDTISLSYGDYVAFIKYYLPEIDINHYAKKSLEFMRNMQSYHLKTKIINHISDHIEQIFGTSPSETYFDFNNEYEKCSFKELLEGDLDFSYNDFLNSLETIIPKIIDDKAYYIIQPISIAKVEWIFEDNRMHFENEDSFVIVKKQAIDDLKNAIKQDFEEFGELTYKYATIESSINYMMSFDNFVVHFPKDIEILKNNNPNFEDFCNFMKKYRIGSSH